MLNRKHRVLGTGFAVVLLMLSIVGLPNVPTTSAQSVGGYSGAILDLVPLDGSNTVSSAVSGATPGSFYITGVVYYRGTVTPTCTLPADSNQPVVFAYNPATGFSPVGPGRRAGIWRMWGYRTTAVPEPQSANPSAATGGISGGKIAVVNMSIELEAFNATIQLQGTLGRVFGAIESAGHPPSDILAITGGTGSLRAASGDAIITPLTDATNTPCGASTQGAGAFQVALKEGFKPPRFTNVIPEFF